MISNEQSNESSSNKSDSEALLEEPEKKFHVKSDDIPTVGMIAVPDIKKPVRKFEEFADFDLDGDLDDNIAYLYNEVCFLPEKLKYD